MFFNPDQRQHWFFQTKYPDYKKFLSLFDIKDRKHHLERGGGTMYYKWDYGYPVEVDPAKEYLTFLENTVSSNIAPEKRFLSSWWVDYPQGAYAVAHQHEPFKRFTAVMFLTDYDWVRMWPNAGNLFAMSNLIGYKEWSPVGGDVIIMDGDMYHGTYPTINERKVFVVDFEYK